MKSIRHIALSTLLTLSVFGSVLYTSCTKNSCSSVSCLNTGSCSGGVCSCPTGIGGANCEIVYRLLYANTYKGSATYSTLDSNGTVDSSFLVRTDTSNTLVFSAPNDSMYTGMLLVWNRPGKPSVNMTITLSNFGASGSTFTLTAPPVDTFTYTGTGTVNQTTASLNLVESHPHSASVAVTLSNYIKQ